MAESNSKTTEQKITEAIAQRIASGVSSVSVDGMSTSYASLKDQLEALSVLKKMEASKNPLKSLKIFKVKSEG